MSQYKVMVFGVGAFSSGMLKILKEQGIEVSTYLTRDYAHYGPMREGKTYHKEYYPNPCEILRKEPVDLIIPMSIEWGLQEWTEELLSLNIPILSPKGEAFQIERDRFFSQSVCKEYGVPFAESFVAGNKLEALKIIEKNPYPFVIKNTFCSPTSPIHTIVCETLEQTRCWLENIDYKEGVFMQRYMGKNEVGHIAFVSNGELYPFITNQEYKRAFNDNLGIIAGAPLGGLIEMDKEDRYGIAEELLYPLLPWFKKVNYNGPIQVTAMRWEKKWVAVEFNIRLGITCGPLIARILKDPYQTFRQVAMNGTPCLDTHENMDFGASLTLAGYGYPYVQIVPPKLSVQIIDDFTCDVWWNEVDADSKKNLYTSGHRIADLTAVGTSIDEALSILYSNIRKIECPGSYYRTDIGKSMWPPVYD